MNETKTKTNEMPKPANGSEPPPVPTAPMKPKRGGLDPELQALARIDRVLADFESDEIKRMLVWLCDRYELSVIPTRAVVDEVDLNSL